MKAIAHTFFWIGSFLILAMLIFGAIVQDLVVASYLIVSAIPTFFIGWVFYVIADMHDQKIFELREIQEVLEKILVHTALKNKEPANRQDDYTPRRSVQK